MKESSGSLIVPSLILALGLLGGTALTVLTQDAGAWVLSGPLLFSLAIIIAYAVLRESLRPAAEAMVWAGAILVGAVIGAIFDPTEVGTILLLTGPLAWVLLISDRRQQHCQPGSGRTCPPNFAEYKGQ